MMLRLQLITLITITQKKEKAKNTRWHGDAYTPSGDKMVLAQGTDELLKWVP